jgi:hypothetical protein
MSFSAAYFLRAQIKQDHFLDENKKFIDNSLNLSQKNLLTNYTPYNY